jgi:hypothetical protein
MYRWLMINWFIVDSSVLVTCDCQHIKQNNHIQNFNVYFPSNASIYMERLAASKNL